VQKLRDSELHYRRLFEAAQDGILILNAETGMIEDVNPYLIKMLGYSHEEFVEKRLWEVGAFKDIEASQDAFEALQKNEYIRYEDLPLKTKNGQLIQVEFVSNVYLLGDEKVIQCNIRDITARKRTEKALHESEARYRRLFETAQDGVLILDARTGMIEDVNPYLIKMLGYSREEFIKKKLWEVGAFKDIEASKDAFEALQENEYIRYEDLPLKTKNGQLIQVEFVSNVYLVGGEKVIQCDIRDITEHRRILSALRENEKKYYNLVNQSPDGIFIIESSGNILTVNKAMCRELGFSEDEFLTMNIWDIIPHQYLDQYRQRLQKILAGESFEEAAEYAVQGKDGKIHYVEVLSTPHYSGRNIIGFQGTARDITARKDAEEALRNSETKLRSLFAAMLDVIIVYDADGRYLEIAPTNFSNLYRPLNEMLGRTVTELFPSDQASFFLDKIRHTLKTGQLTNAEYSLSIEGQVRWFSASVSPLSSNSVIWVAHDVTLRKAAEQQIQRQFAHLTALSAIDRVIASNFDLRVSLSEILTHVTMELGVDAADILILNSTSQVLEYGAERGFRTQAVRKANVRLGESHAGRVALERQLIQIPDLRNEPDNLLLTTLLAGEDFVCYYGVPLITRGQVKGVLEVFHRAAFEPDVEWFDFLNTLAGQAAIAIENATLFENLQRSNLDLTLAYDATIEGWSAALDLRDKETEGHSQRVTKMAVKLARTLGLSEAELVQVRWGALLHDIGKMGVPDEILHKPGSLTDEEWGVMKKHPIFAYEMLAPIRYLRQALDIPYCHHEKWDGSGYPCGLKGQQIPLAARIFAAVDVWDALTSNRPYRAAWTKEKALEYIRASSGTHFDPQVVDVFLQMPDRI
jgi:PAS domain S-box-containing protein/putative nucleotidyltransferase with HDIG domain